MRHTSTVIAVFAAATLVAAVGAGMADEVWWYGGQAVAMLTLAAYVHLTGRGVPQPVLAALAAFCVLSAVAALVDLTAAGMPSPGLPDRGANGCPVESPEYTAYWTSRLRYGQLAESLRGAALVCAILAVQTMPGPRRRRLVVAVPLVAVVLFGLFTIFTGPADAGRIIAITPGLATVGAAAVLTSLAVTRTAGGLPARAALIAGAALTLVPAVPAMDRLASLHWQIPEPLPDSAFRMCGYAIAGPATPPLTTVAVTAAVAALTLAAPALLARAALRMSRRD